jgi:uroporphyrin-III C-methyltransferase
VQYVTGHDVAGALPEDLNMAALADPTATTVLYMGRRTFPKLAARLMAAGLPGDTPVLLAESISTPDQRLSRHTVASLSETTPDMSSTAPALILYGPLAEQED